jgi:hypothetical protein
MNRLLAAGIAFAIFVGIGITVATTQSPEPGTMPYADVNADGDVNSGDQGIVASQYGVNVFPPNPCVQLEYWDDANPIPTERGPQANSLLEIVTPRGWSYGVPGEHPGYAVLASGSPWPLRACP